MEDTDSWHELITLDPQMAMDLRNLAISYSMKSPLSVPNEDMPRLLLFIVPDTITRSPLFSTCSITVKYFILLENRYVQHQKVFRFRLVPLT